MFKRGYRLSREEIALVSREGTGIHTGLFSLKIKNISEKTPKFAFVVSKKELKTAVDRNSAKRRLRAAMRKVLPSLKPLFCMVFIKKTALKALPKEIEEALSDALAKKGFIIK